MYRIRTAGAAHVTSYNVYNLPLTTLDLQWDYIDQTLKIA